MSAFLVAALWEYVPAVRSLGRGILEELIEGIPDMLSDPEGAIFVMGFLLLVWVLVVALRFVAHLIGDLLSGTVRSGPQGLGLN
jgi:hypothetical protein